MLCENRLTECSVALRPQYERRPTADRVHCDRKVAARNIGVSDFLIILKFLAMTKKATATVRQPVRPTTTIRHCDCTGTLLRSAAILSKNWSQYSRSLGETAILANTASAGCISFHCVLRLTQPPTRSGTGNK